MVDVEEESESFFSRSLNEQEEQKQRNWEE
jgi:hypothetical protein